MSKKTNIALKHGEIEVNLQVEGISGKKSLGAIEEVFKLFMSSIETESVKTIQEAYSEMGLLNPEDTEQDHEREKDRKPPLSIVRANAEKEENQDEPEEAPRPVAGSVLSMEELLKDVSPLSYKKHGDTYRFQVYYICDNCNHKGRAFVERRPNFKCRECGRVLKLIPATDDKFPHVDHFGNIYVAGKFKPANVHSQEQESKEEPVYTFMLEEEMTNQREEDKPKKLQTK